MRKFKVTVNGNSYLVEVEEITGDNNLVAERDNNREIKVTTDNKVEDNKIEQAPQMQAAASVPSGGTPVKAPLTGNILSVRVKEGDKVTKGDILLTLEALKMENEIVAPVDGKVVAVNARIGSTVNSGDVLIVLE